MATFQVLLKLLDGRTQCLQIPTPTISGEALKRRLSLQTLIPFPLLRLVAGALEIRDETLIYASADRLFPSLTVLLRLRGGKGGFGSLLRGAATKAGQKKTNNFDACRDMSGRRLRHVNAEKRLEEWKAEAEDRKLEKLAEEFLKKKAKEVKKGKGKDGEVEKYLEKFREDSAKCMEAMEESVRESFGLYKDSKRKVLPASGASSSKRLKIWSADESDSDDEEEEDNDGSDGVEEKSVVLDDVNCPSQIKEDGESSVLGLVSGASLDGESSGGCSGHRNLEELGTNSLDGQSSPGCSEQSNLEEANGNHSMRSPAIGCGSGTGGNSSESDGFVESETRQIEVASTQNAEVSTVDEMPQRNEIKSVASHPVKSDFADKGSVMQTTLNFSVDEPFSFNKYNSAAELEVLGMEKLKAELQSHGLKCGGTLQERAARLYLLKTTPLGKLPKKLLAAKAAGK